MAAHDSDSSALVKRYVQEIGTSWTITLTDPPAGNTIFTALVTGAEIVAALTRRARMGSITGPDATAAIAAFKSEFRGLYQIVLVTDAVLDQAMELAERHGLRGYDAIQLASALATRDSLAARGIAAFTFVSADTGLNAAAQAEGMTVEDPNHHP